MFLVYKENTNNFQNNYLDIYGSYNSGVFLVFILFNPITINKWSRA